MSLPLGNVFCLNLSPFSKLEVFSVGCIECQINMELGGDAQMKVQGIQDIQAPPHKAMFLESSDKPGTGYN